MIFQTSRNSGATHSVGGTGSALDNAVGESFNSALEWKLLHNNNFYSRKRAVRPRQPGSKPTTEGQPRSRRLRAAVFWRCRDRHATGLRSALDRSRHGP